MSFDAVRVLLLIAVVAAATAYFWPTPEERARWFDGGVHYSDGVGDDVDICGTGAGGVDVFSYRDRVLGEDVDDAVDGRFRCPRCGALNDGIAHFETTTCHQCGLHMQLYGDELKTCDARAGAQP